MSHARHKGNKPRDSIYSKTKHKQENSQSHGGVSHRRGLPLTPPSEDPISQLLPQLRKGWYRQSSIPKIPQAWLPWPLLSVRGKLAHWLKAGVLSYAVPLVGSPGIPALGEPYPFAGLYGHLRVCTYSKTPIVCTRSLKYFLKS